MKTEIGKQYCVTCDSACDIVDTATGNTIHTHHEGEAQSYFTAIGLEVEASDDTAVVTEVFKSAPAGNGGGGYIESDLNVGHGASAAVAAVCTLTLGDLGTGGTLEDSNGQSVELEAPHSYAVGSAAFRDVTEAGTLTIGEWSKEWEAQPRRDANMILTPLESYDGEETPYKFSATNEYKTCEFEWYAPAGSTVQDLKVAINDEDGTPHWSDGPPLVVASINDEGKLVLEANAFGAQGNGIKVTPSDNTPFELSEEVEFTNGQDARTAVDVYNDIHEDADCPVDVTLDADELGLGFTAKEYGVNDAISAEGDMFSNWNGMAGGHGDYTVAELVTAISGGFDDITPTAGEAAGTITLTAAEAGADANAITYTAMGCFGGGTVKQGSTTRGKNAVAQTAFKIYLNGAELDVEPAPLPTALTPTTAMKNGGVYTVAADIDAKAITLPANATAEIWVRIGATALNVQLPPAWLWVNGAASDMTGKTDTTFCIAVRNDGVKVLASIAYSYDTTPAQS